MQAISFIAALAGLIAALLLTPAARSFARSMGAVDMPGGRRVHQRATPRMGGLSVVAAHWIALGIAIYWGNGPDEMLAPWQQSPVVGFLLGGMVIAVLGAVDDVKALGAKKKLMGQIVAASIAWAAGARIETFDLSWIGSFEFGELTSYCVTLIWILAFVNAVNLIDGLDGLASGIVLFAAVTNTIVALTTENTLAILLNASLGGAVLGFLFYNFNPATIFLGDTGSLYLGYCLGAAALLTGRQKESTVVALLVPVVALGVPLTDTLFTMLRRFAERRPIFSPDRGHIHHRLLDLGLTHRRVVLFLYGASVLTCAAALGAALGKDWQAGIAIAGAAAVVFGAAVFAGYFRPRLKHRTALLPEEEALRHALPKLLTDERSGPQLSALWARVEELILRDAPFVSADLVADTRIVWQWGADTSSGPEDIEYAFRWQIQGHDHVLRFVVRSSAPSRSERLDMLLRLLADHVIAEVGTQPYWLRQRPKVPASSERLAGARA